MTTYKYKGQSLSGARVSGVVRAYDEFEAVLHQGERVLTAAEARVYNERETRDARQMGADNSRTVNVGGITINGGADRKTARMVERAIRKAVR